MMGFPEISFWLSKMKVFLVMLYCLVCDSWCRWEFVLSVVRC